MAGHRVERVAAQLREEISAIIMRDLKDPRIGMVSITEVKLTPDLRSAIVRVSVVEESEGQQAAIAGLDHARGLHPEGAWCATLQFALRTRAPIRA